MLTEKFFDIAVYAHDITLWVLVLLSILSLGFIIERWRVLRLYTQSSKRIAHRIRETLQSNDLKQVEDLSRDWETLEGRGLAFGLRHAKENGEHGLEEIFESYASIEKPKLDKHLNFLATVGSNAPFIGLLGTVFGIMDAFRGLATSQGDPAVVMVGISKALVATAFGLLVAIPAVIAYNTYQKKVKYILSNLTSVKDLCLAYAKTTKVK